MSAPRAVLADIMEQLGQLRRKRQMEIQHAAEAIGITAQTLSDHEYGRTASPLVLDVAAYARLMRHRLVAQRAGRPPLPIPEALPDLRRVLREQAGLSQRETAQRLDQRQEHVYRIEREAATGTIRMLRLQEYLGAFGYWLTLVALGDTTPSVMEQLTQRRAYLRMSLQEAADAIGVPPVTLSRWERGLTMSPPVSGVAAYAGVLDWQVVAERPRWVTLPIPDAVPHLRRLLRERVGMTQDVLALRMYRPQPDVVRIEREMRDGTVHLERLRSYLAAFEYRLSAVPLGARVTA